MSTDYTSKINLLKDFKEVFGEVVSIKSYELFKMFTIEEILDDRFENEVLVHLFSNKYGGITDLFQDYNAYRRLMENGLTDETTLLLINKIFKLVENGKISKNTLPRMRIITENDVLVFEKIINEGYNDMMFILPVPDSAYSEYGTGENMKDFLIKTLDKFLVTCADFELIEKTYDIIKAYTSINYVNFPLVIMNPFLADEQKISVIKKTYIQKDITKYMTFIKNNITDLKDLDAFIEATVTQNNRVKEKTARTLDVIRRVFFGMRGDYGNLNIDRYENFSIIEKKYKKLFTHKIIKEVYDQSSDYHVKENIIVFLYKLFENDSFIDNLGRATVLPKYGNYLIRDIRSTFETKVKGVSDDLEIAFFKYVVEKNSASSMIQSFPEIYTYFEKYPEIFMNKVSKELCYFREMSRWYIESTCKETLRFYRKMPKVILKDISLAETMIVNNLFLGKTNSYYSEGPKETLEKLGYLLEDMDALIDANPYMKEFIIEKMLMPYADLDEINSVILQGSSDILRDRDAITDLKTFTKKHTEYDAIEAYIKIFTDLAEKLCPEQESIVENLNKLKRDLQILISI